MSAPQMLHGLQVICNPNLTVPGDPIKQRRTWRERLFTFPWRPLKATRTVIPQIPSREVYFLGQTAIAVHPDTWERIKPALHEHDITS